MKRSIFRAFASFGVIACFAGSARAATRISVTLDDGSTVTVDDMSSYSTAIVEVLVLAADRSTVNGCPFDAPGRKGLFKTGDRIVVSNHFIAWLDLTITDGIDFGSSFTGPWSRGELTGFWALNTSRQTFKHFTLASDGNCWNWARNQLIPGSNSPGGEKRWWDHYAPPTEHSISIVTRLDPNRSINDTKVLFSHFYAQLAPNDAGRWRMAADGEVRSGELYYKFTARIANAAGNVDVSDGDDANGIAATLTSEMEYYFRDNDIKSAWRFSPSRQISADNIYVHYGMAYGNGQDMDGTACDVPVAGDQWPSTSDTIDWYAESSAPLVPNFPTGGQGAFHEFPPDTPIRMVLGPSCSRPYVNAEISSYQSENRNNTVVSSGTFLSAGQGAPTYRSGRPYFFYVHLMPNPNGTGTYASPYDVRFNRLIAWNETHDGSLGFGVQSGPYMQRADYSTFAAGQWYYALHSLSSPD